MTYDDLARAVEQLNYRDKFRLAQLLIQLGRKEEEERAPEERRISPNSPETIEYVAERLLKLRPAKKSALVNAITAMFQFQGGISDADKDEVVAELQRRNRLVVDRNGRVTYPG